jgi:hypothetical protein
MTKKCPPKSASKAESKKSTTKKPSAGQDRGEAGGKHPMKMILNLLEGLTEADLYALCEAIDVELQRREDALGEVPDSARRRAVEREQSYRRRNGAGAPPIRITGIGKPTPRRRAA